MVEDQKDDYKKKDATKIGIENAAEKTSTHVQNQTEAKSQVTGLRSGICICCRKTCEKRCTNCRSSSGQTIYYCSRDCQVADWPVHKHFCALKMPSKKFPKMGILN